MNCYTLRLLDPEGFREAETFLSDHLPVVTLTMDFASQCARLQRPVAASTWRSRCPHSKAASGSPPKFADHAVDEDYRYRCKLATGSIGKCGMCSERDMSRLQSYPHMQEANIASKESDTKHKVRNIKVFSMDDHLLSVELGNQNAGSIPTVTGELPAVVRHTPDPMNNRMPAINRIRRVHFAPRESCPSNSSDLSSSKILANKITQTVAIVAALNFPDHRESDRLSRRQVFDVAVNTIPEIDDDACENDSGDFPLVLRIPSRSSTCRPCNAKDPRNSSSEESSEISESESQVCSLGSNVRQPPQNGSSHPLSQQAAIGSSHPQSEVLDSATRLASGSAVAYFIPHRKAQFNGQDSCEIPILPDQSRSPEEVLNHESADGVATPYDLRTSLAGIAGLAQKHLQTSRASKPLARSRIPNHSFEISDPRSRGEPRTSNLHTNPRRCFKGLEPTTSSDARAGSYVASPVLYPDNMPLNKRLKYRSALFATAPFAAQKHVVAGNKTSRSSYWFDVPFPVDDDEPTGRRSRVASTAPAADLDYPVMNEGSISSGLNNLTLTDSAGVDPNATVHDVQHHLSRDISSDSNPCATLDGRPQLIDTMLPSIIETSTVLYPGTLWPTFMLCPGDIMMTRNLRTEESKVGGYVTLFPDPSYFEERGVDVPTMFSGYYQFTLFDMVLRLGAFDNHDDWNWIPSSFLSLFMYAPGDDRTASAAASWWLVDSKPSAKLPQPDHSLENEAASMALNTRLHLDLRTTDLVISTVPDPMLECKKKWRAQWWSPHFLPVTQDVLIRACYSHSPSPDGAVHVNKRKTMVAVELYTYCGDSAVPWRFLGRDTFYYGPTQDPPPRLRSTLR